MHCTLFMTSAVIFRVNTADMSSQLFCIYCGMVSISLIVINHHNNDTNIIVKNNHRNCQTQTVVRAYYQNLFKCDKICNI